MKFLKTFNFILFLCICFYKDYRFTWLKKIQGHLEGFACYWNCSSVCVNACSLGQRSQIPTPSISVIPVAATDTLSPKTFPSIDTPSNHTIMSLWCFCMPYTASVLFSLDEGLLVFSTTMRAIQFQNPSYRVSFLWSLLVSVFIRIPARNSATIKDF